MRKMQLVLDTLEEEAPLPAKEVRLASLTLDQAHAYEALWNRSRPTTCCSDDWYVEKWQDTRVEGRGKKRVEVPISTSIFWVHGCDYNPVEEAYAYYERVVVTFHEAWGDRKSHVTLTAPPHLLNKAQELLADLESKLLLL